MEQLNANKAMVRPTLCLDSFRPKNNITGERRRPACKLKPMTFDSIVQIERPDTTTSISQKTETKEAVTNSSQSDILIAGTVFTDMGADYDICRTSAIGR